MFTSSYGTFVSTTAPEVEPPLDNPLRHSIPNTSAEMSNLASFSETFQLQEAGGNRDSVQDNDLSMTEESSNDKTQLVETAVEDKEEEQHENSPHVYENPIILIEQDLSDVPGNFSDIPTTSDGNKSGSVINNDRSQMSLLKAPCPHAFGGLSTSFQSVPEFRINMDGLIPSRKPSSHNFNDSLTKDAGIFTSTELLSMQKKRPSVLSSFGSTRWFTNAAGTTHRRYYRRLVFKNGERNFCLTHVPLRGRRYLTDIFTTLLNVKWRLLLTLFVISFVLSWLVFAALWCLLLTVHGDFREDKEPDWQPCISNVENFASALLFSIETQHTIGYGYRYPTHDCPEAITLVMTQCCFGVVLQALMAGLVFAKLARPRMRAQTLMFSKRAVICKRDGILMLLFRVGDMRKSHILDSKIRGILLKKRVTQEGEVLPMEEHHVDFGYNEGRDRLYLAWPTTVEHRITNSSSPFWGMSAQDLNRQHFELIVILEGIVESTGMTTHARCSYLPSEILWGYRLKSLFTYQRDNGQYEIDFERFHAVEEIRNFPQISAMELARRRETRLPGDAESEGCLFPDDDDHGSVFSRSTLIPMDFEPIHRNSHNLPRLERTITEEEEDDTFGPRRI